MAPGRGSQPRTVVLKYGGIQAPVPVIGPDGEGWSTFLRTFRSFLAAAGLAKVLDWERPAQERRALTHPSIPGIAGISGFGTAMGAGGNRGAGAAAQMAASQLAGSVNDQGASSGSGPASAPNPAQLEGQNQQAPLHEAAMEQTTRDSEAVKLLLNQCLSEALQAQVGLMYDSTEALWAHLCTRFAVTMQTALLDARRDWTDLRQKPSEKSQDFVTRACGLREKLIMGGDSCDDAQLAIKIWQGLDPRFNTIKATLAATQGVYRPDLVWLQTKLPLVESTLTHETTQPSVPALFVNTKKGGSTGGQHGKGSKGQHGGGNHKGGNYNNNSSGGRSKDGNGEKASNNTGSSGGLCYGCGEAGHVKANCKAPQWKRDAYETSQLKARLAELEAKSAQAKGTQQANVAVPATTAKAASSSPSVFACMALPMLRSTAACAARKPGCRCPFPHAGVCRGSGCAPYRAAVASSCPRVTVPVPRGDTSGGTQPSLVSSRFDRYSEILGPSKQLPAWLVKHSDGLASGDKPRADSVSVRVNPLFEAHTREDEWGAAPAARDRGSTCSTGSAAIDRGSIIISGNPFAMLSIPGLSADTPATVPANLTMTGCVTRLSDDDVLAYRSALWILDTAAGRHCCFDVTMMYELEPCDITVIYGEGEAKAEHMGKVTLETEVDGKKQYVTLTKVLLLPALGYNLFSWTYPKEQYGCRLVDGAESVTLEDSSGATMFEFNHRLPSGVRAATGTPVLPTTTTTVGDATGSTLVCTVTTDNAATNVQLWHNRFGHPGYGTLADTVARKVLPTGDVPVPASAFREAAKQAKCEACIMGKHKSRPFPSSDRRPEAPMVVVHIDQSWGL